VETSLIVSNVALWIAVVCLSAVVLALLRQIGILHERIAPAGAQMGREGPRPGEPAPVLDHEDWSGRGLRVGGAASDARATLLLFVSPTCPVCKILLPQARSVCAAEGSRSNLILASDGPREEHTDFVATNAIDRDRYVLSSALGLAFQVGRLPYAVLIDAEGVVRARGLVNTREHLESLFEAQRLGVASVQEYVAGDPQQRVA
jgi:methylamine dehydrogenase accessory protein MauD